MPSSCLRPLSLAIISAATCFASAADLNESMQQGTDIPNTYQLDKVGIKAKRIKEKPESPYSTTESSELQTQIFTREDIVALNPKTVWDVLEQVPGFQVEAMGHKHQEWYYFRGSQSAFGVILDGVYLTQLDRVISSLPVDDIESITVIRDATAMTLGPLTNFSGMGSGYGGGSTGSGNEGFVVIKTRRATKREGEFIGSYGSYDAQKYNLSLGDKQGKFDYRISGGYSNDPGKSGWNMHQRDASLFFRGGYTGETLEADVLYSWQHGMQNGRNVETVYPTLTSGVYNYAKVGQMSTGGGGINFPRLDLETAALNATQHWNAHQATTITAGYSAFILSMPFQGSVYSNQDSYSTSFSLRHVITYQNNTFKAGVQRLSYLAPTTTSGGSIARADEKMNGIFVEDEHKFFDNKLSVDAGIRVDQKRFDAGMGSGLTTTSEKAKIAPAYTLGAALKAIPRLTITGRVSHSVNDPSEYQISTTGAPLHAEKHDRVELGAQANLHPAFNPYLTTYMYHNNNQKTATSVSGSYYNKTIYAATGIEYDYVTESSVNTHGFDMGANGRILQPLDYQIMWSIVGTNSASANSSIAHHLGSAGLRYHEGAFAANANARYVGRMDNYSSVSALPGISPYPLGDYTTIDANVSYDFKVQGKDTKVMLYGRNLTNKHYATKMDSTGSGGAAAIDPGINYGIQLVCKFF